VGVSKLLFSSLDVGLSVPLWSLVGCGFLVSGLVLCAAVSAGVMVATFEFLFSA